ncbi:MAG: TOTE conflict system archaeo-eukaryotic primase domain-containing protein [Planctomycetota bacterium]|jgi:hypothetical protein
MKSRTTSEKIAIYRNLFTGLQNVYGTYDHRTGRVRQAKEPVTDQVILAHLKGKQPYGVYLLVKDTIRALAVDFDEDKLRSPLAFRAEARRLGLSTYIERSKSKGYHVWMFFVEKGVLARKARLVAGYILTAIGKPNIEIFPKQDALDENTSYGNFINAPLFGALVPKGKTVFVHPAEPREVYPDQWELLGGVQGIEERILDDVIRNYDLDLKQQANDLDRPAKPADSTKSVPQAFGLPLCAQRMLTDGVTSQQRVSCFRLAVNLRRAGIPPDLTLTMLLAWARKNRPQDGKRIITEAEIKNQVKDAYEKPYRSCGCEDPAVAPYCDKRCRLYPRSARRRSSQ